MARIEDLDARARSAYLELSRHYWQRGRLPCVDRDLAAICKVSIVTFRHMRVQIGWAFDGVDAENRWRDHELEAERLAAIVALGRDPADFAPQPDHAGATDGDAPAAEPSKRSLAGKANADKRWGLQRQEAARRGQGEGVGTMPFASGSMPNGMPSGIGSDANGTPIRMDLASSHPIQVLDDDDDDSSISLISSSSSSSSERGRASDADANSRANLHPASHPRDANADANINAKPNAGAAPVAADRTSRPGHAAVPTKREVLDRVALALGGRHRPGLCSLGEIGPIMKLLHGGFDLERHVIPVLMRHTKDPLKTFAAPWIRDEAEKLREAESEPGYVRPSGQATSRKVFVEKDTSQWNAWMDHRLKTDGKPFKLKYTRGGREGWDFDAEWPPGYQPARAAAE